jgi:hypothetical protein
LNIEILTIIREWTNFAADICILLITIYTFHFSFVSKKIKFITFGQSSSNSEGESFSVVIENKTAKAIVIKEMFIIVNNEYKIGVKRYDTPLILSPFHTERIETEKFSYMVPEVKFNGNDIILQVNTSNKKIFLKFGEKIPNITKDMKNSPNNVTKVRNEYNGKVVPQMAKYVLNISINGIKKVVFIFKTGLMTEEVLGYNVIPNDVTVDKESLEKFFQNWLEKYKIEFYIEELEDNLKDNSFSLYELEK